MANKKILSVLKADKSTRQDVSALSTIKQIISSAKLDFRIASEQRLDNRSLKKTITYTVDNASIDRYKSFLEYSVSITDKKQLPIAGKYTTRHEYENLTGKLIDGKTFNVALLNTLCFLNKLDIEYTYNPKYRELEVDFTSYVKQTGLLPISWILKIQQLDDDLSLSNLDNFIDSRLIVGKVKLVIASVIAGKVVKSLTRFDTNQIGIVKTDKSLDTLVDNLTVVKRNLLGELLSKIIFSSKKREIRFKDVARISLDYHSVSMQGYVNANRQASKLKEYNANAIKTKKDDSQTTFKKKTKCKISYGTRTLNPQLPNLLEVTENILEEKRLAIAATLQLGYIDGKSFPNIRLLGIPDRIPDYLADFISYMNNVKKLRPRLDRTNILCLVAVTTMPDDKQSRLVNTKWNHTVVGLLATNGKNNKVKFYCLGDCRRYLPEYVPTGKIVQKTVIKYKKPDGSFVSYDASKQEYVSKLFSPVERIVKEYPQMVRVDHADLTPEQKSAYQKIDVSYDHITPLAHSVLSQYGMRDSMPFVLTDTTYNEKNGNIWNKYFKSFSVQLFPIDKNGNITYDIRKNLPLQVIRI